MSPRQEAFVGWLADFAPPVPELSLKCRAMVRHPSSSLDATATAFLIGASPSSLPSRSSGIASSRASLSLSPQLLQELTNPFHRSSAQVVITWLTGLVGSAQLVNWVVMSVTWIRWNHGLKSQNISRDTLYVRVRSFVLLPATSLMPCGASQSPFQPFAAWYALVSSTLVLFMQGYSVFLKGKHRRILGTETSLIPLPPQDNWDTPNFIFAYAMPIVRPFAPSPLSPLTTLTALRDPLRRVESDQEDEVPARRNDGRDEFRARRRV